MRLVYGPVSIAQVGKFGWRICASTCVCVDSGGCKNAFITHPHHYDGQGASVPNSVDAIKLSEWEIVPVSVYDIRKNPRGYGYVIRGPASIFITGDSDLTQELVKVKNVDILIIAMGDRGTMTPEEVADAVMSIRPKITIPYHYAARSQYALFRDLAQPYTQIVAVWRG